MIQISVETYNYLQMIKMLFVIFVVIAATLDYSQNKITRSISNILFLSIICKPVIPMQYFVLISMVIWNFIYSNRNTILELKIFKWVNRKRWKVFYMWILPVILYTLGIIFGTIYASPQSIFIVINQIIVFFAATTIVALISYVLMNLLFLIYCKLKKKKFSRIKLNKFTVLYVIILILIG